MKKFFALKIITLAGVYFEIEIEADDFEDACNEVAIFGFSFSGKDNTPVFIPGNRIDFIEGQGVRTEGVH